MDRLDKWRGGQDVKAAARKAVMQWFESTPRLHLEKKLRRITNRFTVDVTSDSRSTNLRR